MNNPIALILQCITLLFLSNMAKGSKDTVKGVVSATIKDLSLPTSTIGDMTINSSATSLLSLITWMLSVGPDITFDRIDIISKLRIILYEDLEYITDMEDALNTENLNDTEVHGRIQSNLSSLKFELNQQKVRKLISRVNHRINYSGSYTDHKEVMRELQDDLTELTAGGSGEEHDGYIGRVSTQGDGLEKIFRLAKESESTEGMLKTGFTGLNRLLGGKGFRRGEMVNIGALSHHYKSGLLLDLTRQVPMLNTPYMYDKDKKPMVLRVSFENKLEQDLPLIYKALIEQDTGEALDLNSIDPAVAAKYVQEKLSVNNYTVAVECYDPSGFNIGDLLSIIEGYEASGYEIHMLIVDYIELIAKGGREMRGDEQISDAFEKLRNHCHPRNITVVTAHQLDTRALEIAREGSPNFVAKVRQGSYFYNCKSLITKLDVSITCHIIESGEKSYLTVGIGKHRLEANTKNVHQTYFQQFNDVGGLKDDVVMGDKKPKPIQCHHGSLSAYLNEQSYDTASDGGGKDNLPEAW